MKFLEQRSEKQRSKRSAEALHRVDGFAVAVNRAVEISTEIPKSFAFGKLRGLKKLDELHELLAESGELMDNVLSFIPEASHLRFSPELSLIASTRRVATKIGYSELIVKQSGPALILSQVAVGATALVDPGVLG